MLLPNVVKGVLAASAMLLGVSVACAQTFPNKPLRILTSAVGGSPDLQARLVAQGITNGLGQNVIVENRPSVKATELAAQALPDGYTLLYASIGLHVTGALLQKLSFDPVRDFSAISLVVDQPNLIVVTPSLPVKSVQELIAYGRARPGELNYGSSTTGSSNHLAAELFSSMTGVKMVRIGYKGMGQVIIDLLGGQVHLSFPAAASVIPHIKTGRLRALAVASKAPYALLPGLPTVAASGVPGFEASGVYGMLAPARTPRPVILRLNQEIVSFLRTPQAREKFLNAGTETVISTPEEAAAALKSESVKWAKVIRDAGIKAE